MPATSAVRASGSTAMTPVSPEVSRPWRVRLRRGPGTGWTWAWPAARWRRRESRGSSRAAAPRRRREQPVRRSLEQTHIYASPRSQPMRPHEPRNHTAHHHDRGVFTDGTGQRVQHRPDRRRAGQPCSPRSPTTRRCGRRSSPAHYSGYQVLEGGQGAGTVATWKLQATKSRVRDVKASVDVAGHTVIEKDANSTMVTNWTVAPAGTGLDGHRQDRRGRAPAASGASSRRRSRRWACARSRPRCWRT